MKKYLIGIDDAKKVRAIQQANNLIDQVNNYNDLREYLLLKRHKDPIDVIMEAASAKSKLAAELSKQIDTSTISKLIYSDVEKIRLLPEDSQRAFNQAIEVAQMINSTDGEVLSFFGNKIRTNKKGDFHLPNLKFEAKEFASIYMTNKDDIEAFEYCQKVMEALKKVQNDTPPCLYISNVFAALRFIGYNQAANEWNINGQAIANFKIMFL